VKKGLKSCLKVIFEGILTCDTLNLRDFSLAAIDERENVWRVILYMDCKVMKNVSNTYG
jgi:hypothetical protein